MPATQTVLDRYYLETRCMLIEIAAMLDRNERAGDTSPDDPRLQRIHRSLELLSRPDAGPNRSEQLLNFFSDLD